VGEPPPLIATALAPVPAGGAEWLEGSGGLRLRAALFPLHAARGSVVLSPGRTEPIEKYFEVVEDLRSRGFSVLVHDWRGHGLSARLHRDPKRGHADGLPPFIDDYARLLSAFETRLPRPWIALGHSMGGGLSTLAIAEGRAKFEGLVLSAPMMGVLLGAAPVWWARLLATVFNGLRRGGAYVRGPGDPFGGSFESNVLTHDPARWARAQALLQSAPELQIGGVTWAWLSFALQLSERLRRAPIDRLAIPLAIVMAGDERLVDNAATRAFARKLPSAQLVEVEGAFHEILMETDEVRARFWAAFDTVAEAVRGDWPPG
jgi:lysophospholipase